MYKEDTEQLIKIEPENVVIGGTNDYTELTNKPQINNVELSGNKTLDDLGIQAKGDYLTETTADEKYEPKGNYLSKDVADETYQQKGDYLTKETADQDYQVKGNYATKDELPTKTSELTNDSGFLTSIPSNYKTKEENDELYQTKGDYALKAEIPTKTSELTNDSNFITEETDPTVPSYVKSITEADITKWNQGYDLPIASADVLGGVKIGDGLSIDSTGLLSATGGSGGGVIELTGTQDEPIDFNYLVKTGIYNINGWVKHFVYSIDIQKQTQLKNTSRNASLLETPLLLYISVSEIRCHFFGITEANQLTVAITSNANIRTDSDGKNYADWEYKRAIIAQGDNSDASVTAGNELTSKSQLLNVLRTTVGIPNSKPLDSLKTTDKTSLVAAINELNDRIAALEGGE